MNCVDSWVGDRVSAQSEAKVIWCTHQHIFQLCDNLFIDLVQAEVQVLELRASHQEPVRRLVAFGISTILTLDGVEDWDRLFWLLLLLQLFVLLDDCVTLLELALVRLNLICREGNSTKAVKEWHHVFS